MNDLIVETEYGKVEGFEKEGLRRWFGIPYAAPPTGKRRFKRAIPAEPWAGIRECKKMGNSPYQFAPPGQLAKMGDSPVKPSEDCLYLNIWAPVKAEKVPVLVWFYGGANHMGEASVMRNYVDGFARDGIIGVNFNYRLGPLGYYDFSKLDSSFDSNCAISDMIQALKWVKKNIAAFGGDADNITILGQSAGGTGVYAMLSSPAAKGTFHKAIIMSGLAGNITSYESHKLNNDVFFDALNLAPSNVSELKTMPVEHLMKGGIEAHMHSTQYNPGLMFQGSVLDDLIPKHPWEAMADGSAKEISCIIGSTKDDGSVFYAVEMGTPESWEKVREMLEKNHCLEKYEELKNLYGGKEDKKALMDLATDRMFWADSIRCSLAQSQYNRVYSYRFDYVTPENRKAGIGACHSADVHGVMRAKVYQDDPDREPELQKVCDDMHNAFVSFIKTGNPNHAGLSLEWEPYELEKRATCLFDTENSLVYDPKREYYDVWKDLKIYW